MTEPIVPHELSGLVDGELDPARAQEVRAAVEADDALKAELEELEQADRVWSRAASGAAFAPTVAMPSTGLRAARAAMMVAGMFGLACVWMLPKVIAAPLAALGLHAVALALVIAGLVSLVGKGEPNGKAPVREDGGAVSI